MKTKHWMTLVAILLACLVGCSSTLPGTTAANRVNHIVLCWLKDPGNIAHRKRIIEVSESFRKIPKVLEVRVGQSLPGDRNS